MPTIPLYNTAPLAPGAWRHVTAPGGYQWWRLDAIDDSTKSIICVAFFDGRWNDPAYRHRYLRFTRSPTLVDPPQPAEYRAVEIAFYTPANPPMTRLISAAAADFEASSTEMRVRIGEYFLKPLGDDRYVMSGPAMELTLRPIGIDGSLWHVTGTILDGGRFIGRGVLHQAFDVTPPKRQLSFRVLLNDRAIIGAEEFAGGRSYPEDFAVAGFELREPQMLMKESEHTVLKYSIATDPKAIAIVELA